MMNTLRSILVIGGSTDDRIMVDQCVGEYFSGAMVYHAKDVAVAKKNLNEVPIHYDAIVLIIEIQDITARQLVDDCNAYFPAIPIVVLMASADAEFVLKTAGSQAADYLLKTQLSPFNLFKSLTCIIAQQSQIDSIASQKEELCQIVNMNPVAMWQVDMETGKIRDSNLAALQFFGCFKDVFESYLLSDIMYPNDFVLFGEAVSGYRKHGSFAFSGIYTFAGRDSNPIELAISSIVLEKKGSPHVLFAADNMSEATLHLKNIEHQNRLLKDISWLESNAVRAPLARLSELSRILKTVDIDSDKPLMETIIQSVLNSSEELENVVRRITERSAGLRNWASIYKDN